MLHYVIAMHDSRFTVGDEVVYEGNRQGVGPIFRVVGWWVSTREEAYKFTLQEAKERLHELTAGHQKYGDQRYTAGGRGYVRIEDLKGNPAQEIRQLLIDFNPVETT